MRPRPKGRGLIGLVSSFPTGNSVLKNGVSTVVNDNVTDAGVAALEQYSENLPDSK
ncbi:MAG: hypothetical protein KAJ24_04055 [Candidatus Aenigmarchaeota archaeon]|nr:hypothetical protein [Candidatus Aenigmarchaeota archaeon]